MPSYVAEAQAYLTGKHPLTIDDVLNEEQLDRATLSPDGKWVAAVVRRGAHAGETYGRASYDVDPTRADVWLISTKTGARRAITQGASRAAGFWCATWSPDGQRLAMLSTFPKKGEPRGGNNVRLYVWNRTSGAMRRMSEDGVMTQTRYGAPLDKIDLRGGADRGTIAHACTTGSVADNAPFVWLDGHRLLVATLPKGQVAAGLDSYERPFQIAARDAARLHDGLVPTASMVASGSALSPQDDAAPRAILRIIDARSGEQTTIASVPAYPFHGSLTASVSPDGKRLAILASLGTFQPQADRRFPNSFSDRWLAERQLGFADLTSAPQLRWISLPAAARYPLELYGWSPNSRSVVLRARGDPFSATAPLFVAHADHGDVVSLSLRLPGQAEAGEEGPYPSTATWVNDTHVVARTRDGKWMLSGSDGTTTALSGPPNAPLPEQLVRAGDRSLVGFAGSIMVRLDPAKAALVPMGDAGGAATFALPEDGDFPAPKRLLSLHRADGADLLASIDTLSGVVGPSIPAIGANLLDSDLAVGRIIYSQVGPDGVSLHQASLTGEPTRQLLGLDTYLSQVAWGETRLIKYKNVDGAELNGSVILPPNYSPYRRYPTLVWVYGGYEVPSDLHDDDLTSPWMAGIYNLYLYAARGYVVLVPSIPLGGHDGAHDVYTQIPKGVMPAIDRLIALGIADPAKLAVFGQSYGGYSVYALVGQTDRFRAAVAIAGFSDLSSNYGEFDPTARGYPGIDHEKAVNWAMTDQFGLKGPPWRDAEDYARNSPLTYVDRVNTPLLMIHGEMDIRGAPSQAERFFYGLYAQGKAAELVRYGGESHSLAQSPANVRDVFSRTVAWFDRYLAPSGSRAGP